jgi:transcriptional regulator GlxA family with amidase domain
VPPWGFWAKPWQLTDEHVSLRSILPAARARDVEARLAEAMTTEERSRIVQSFFRALLEATARPPHPIVVEAARRILRQHGSPPVAPLARDLGLSARQMERLFRRSIGVGPKRFASIAQFDWTLAQCARRVPWATLAGEAGYSDQAHFVRSFAARAGLTPGRYAAEARRADVGFLQYSAGLRPLHSSSAAHADGRIQVVGSQ